MGPIEGKGWGLPDGGPEGGSRAALYLMEILCRRLRVARVAFVVEADDGVSFPLRCYPEAVRPDQP